MARTTEYECDSCGRSIPDGMLIEIDFRSYDLKDGAKYITGRSFGPDDLELCPSCGSDVNKAIDRVLLIKRKEATSGDTPAGPA